MKTGGKNQEKHFGTADVTPAKCDFACKYLRGGMRNPSALGWRKSQNSS
jgi:hypothetical protein